MYFVDLEKALVRVPKNVMEWAMRKKEIPEMIVKAVLSLYKEATSKFKVGSGYSGYSDVFPVEVGVHQGSVLSSYYLQL